MRRWLALLAEQAEVVDRCVKAETELRRVRTERDEALDLSASLYADLYDAQVANRMLKARVAVLADLADPKARAFSATVLKTIEGLP